MTNSDKISSMLKRPMTRSKGSFASEQKGGISVLPDTKRSDDRNDRLQPCQAPSFPRNLGESQRDSCPYARTSVVAALMNMTSLVAQIANLPRHLGHQRSGQGGASRTH